MLPPNRLGRAILLRACLIWSVGLIAAALYVLNWFPAWMKLPSPWFHVYIWAPVFVGQGYIFVAMRRVRSAMRASGGVLCDKCAYDLRGIVLPGACPECGVAQTPESIAAAWKDWR